MEKKRKGEQIIQGDTVRCSDGYCPAGQDVNAVYEVEYIPSVDQRNVLIKNEFNESFYVPAHKLVLCKPAKEMAGKIVLAKGKISKEWYIGKVVGGEKEMVILELLDRTEKSITIKDFKFTIFVE